MNNFKRFARRAVKSFNPWQYNEISDKSIGRTIMYIVILLFLSFIIMSIIAIPKIALLPGKLSNEMGKFDNFKVSVDIKMSSPIILTPEDPQIIIDTTGQTQLTTEKLLFTKTAIYYKPIKEVKAINTSIFADVAANRDQISKIVAVITLFALPVVIVTGFFVFFFPFSLNQTIDLSG